MICPYNRVKQTQVLQWENDFVNEDECVVRGCQQIATDTYEMMECPREGCAAWQGGRCRYASVNMENQ